MTSTEPLRSVMPIPWLKRTYERTCEDCGCVWRVPKAVARPPLKGLPIGGRMGMPSVRIDAVIAGNAALSETAASFRHCPNCQSSRYKQRSVRS
jgi:hypothetical protein